MMAAILVVDDDLLLRRFISDRLRKRGLRIIEAATADEAVRILQTDKSVEVVFSDVQMPGSMDGFGLAQWVRLHKPGVPVMLTSGGVSMNAADPRHDGPLIPKPYRAAEVERRIRQLLAQ